MSLRSLFGWLGGQVRGLWRNTADFVTGVSLSDLLPPSIVSTLLFIRDSVPRSLGFTDGPRQHLTGVIVFSVFLIIASFTVLTFVAVGFALVMGPIALARLVPVVNDNWPLSPADWPFWEAPG